MSHGPRDDTVEFSAALCAEEGGQATGSRHHGGHGYPLRRSLHVLIIDDEQELTDALCTMIASWGHTVRRLYDGASGLADTGAQLPNVVLLDIAMPDMDGYELARQLRLRPALHGCYLIAMRASDDSRGGPTMESAIDLFLAKPLDLSVLETLLLMEGERLDRLA